MVNILPILLVFAEASLRVAEGGTFFVGVTVATLVLTPPATKRVNINVECRKILNYLEGKKKKFTSFFSFN